LPDIWRDFFVMVGTAAASLVGLLFLVMSLHISTIRDHPDYDTEATIHAARNNIFHLLTALATSAMLLAPQPLRLVGAEVAAAHLYGLRLPIMFTYKHFIRNRGGFAFSMIVTISTGYLLGIAGGVALLARADWGLYLVAASCTIILLRSVLTAWSLQFGRNSEAHRSAAAGKSLPAGELSPRRVS
jgi:hypothetical protein